ncbi:MAG: CDP-alcohol phosphatidyltransferase family protein [Chloroflexi bacterium]|nr:CDP-alcohol phosphatidyltransferase family protein [Chloroflexota bacterium]
MANLITLARFPLLFLYIAFLYYGGFTLRFWSAPFILLIILMDSIDGIVARARGETSLLGSALDIATDRTLEIMLWVVFAHLGLIPIIVPLIVIARGTTVDAVRAVGMSSGLPPFEQVKSPISRFLVASKFMRSTYGFLKAAAFVTLTLDLAFRTPGAPLPAIHALIHTVALVFTWLAVIWCLARGIPVLVEGYALLKNPPPAKTA